MLLKSKSSLFRLSFLADFYSKIFQNNSNTQGVADPEEDEPESEEDEPESEEDVQD